VFDVARLIADCRAAVAEDSSHKAVREVLARVMDDPAAILAGLGAPAQAGSHILHRSNEITILNLVWGPGMSIMPHDHRTWAVIGVYTGREDNIFWRHTEGRDGREVEACGARSLCAGDVAVLGRDIVHSVLNPIPRLTGALHIYGGDFIAMERSEWDAETLREAPYDRDKVARLFEASNRERVAA
jgi:predicted metal-dependent enzyme (double-stranded beta helix superfamily)